MLAHVKTIPTEPPPQEESIYWKLLRGINISATITLGIFVWQQYQASLEVKAALVIRAAVVDEEIRQLRESIDSRNSNLRQSQHDINEQQDKRIDAISSRLDGHITRDNQRFSR
jgi:phosphoenolpyruvate-protein kinase (PTS system EI component)